MRSLFDDRFEPLVTHPFALPTGGDPADGEKIVGTDGNDNFYGGDGDDTISGLGGNDYLDGGAGSDSLLGGAGFDHLNDGGGGSDTLSGGVGDDVLSVYRSLIPSPDTPDHVLMDGGSGNDWLILDTSNGDGIDYAIQATMLGGAGDDLFQVDTAQHVTIDGGDGADTIESTFGEDRVVTLGAGQDVIQFDWQQGATAMVVTDFATGDDGDTIQIRNLLPNLLQGWDQENPFGEGYLRLLQHGADVVLQYDADGGGNSWSDFIVFQNTQVADFTAFNLDDYPPDGSEPVGELITGTDGFDNLTGTVGADTLLGLGGDDGLSGGDSNDSLSGGAGNDYLDGGSGSDTLDGGDGNDTLTESYGADLMLGGEGDDYIDHAFGRENVTATLDGGNGSDQIGVSFLFGGDMGAAVLYGGTGDDTLSINGAGKATLDGGDGDDQIHLTNPDQRIVLTLGAGHDTVKFDDAVAGGTATVITDFATGPDGDRIELYDFLKSHLTGWDFSSNPFADGYLRLVAEGSDTLLQWNPAGDGSWSDLFLLQGVTPASLTQDNLGGYPGDGSEPTGTLIKGGKADDNLTGDLGPDTLNGAKGFDHLYGGAGDDHLFGGAGNDTLYGGYGADVVDGGTGDDLLDGSAGGADTLIGGAGDDDLAVHRSGPTPAADGLTLLEGGDGDDYITFDTAFGSTDPVSVDGGDGEDWITLGGYVFEASVTGGDGNDTITGGYGAETLDGGAGDDLIIVGIGTPDARITLGVGADVLRLNGTFTFYGSSGHIEVTDFTAKDRLALQDAVVHTFGELADPFNDGHLRLAQVGGDTVLQAVNGSAGDWADVLTLDGVLASQFTSAQLDGYKPGPVWLTGTEGADSLTLGKGLTHVDGGHGDDTIVGSAAADVIIGGQGADVLTGRGGGDVFQYNSIQDSTAAGHDRISDLATVDVIDLSRIDADTTTFGDQAFHMVSAFTGHAGELTLSYNQATDQTTLSGDVDGDSVADLVIVLDHDHRGFNHFVF